MGNNAILMASLVNSTALFSAISTGKYNLPCTLSREVIMVLSCSQLSVKSLPSDSSLLHSSYSGDSLIKYSCSLDFNKRRDDFIVFLSSPLEPYNPTTINLEVRSSFINSSLLKYSCS